MSAATRGEIMYRGQPLDVRSPREALDAGIAMVMQETSLAPDLSVLENIFLPDLGRPGRLSRPAMRRRAGEILADLGQEHALPLDAEARDLSAAQRQLVEIAKALALKANLIIFDEPTASLSPSEVERLFDVIAQLEAAQCAIVFVSHRLEEVFAISDEITVMREGRTVAASQPTSSLNQTELIRLMVGRDIGSIYAASAAAAGTSAAAPILSVRGACARRRSCATCRSTCIAARSWALAAWSAPGGPRRWRRSSACARAPAARSGSRAGRSRRARRLEAIRAGIGFVAEDRRRQSIVPDLSVRENLLLAHLGAHRGFGLGYGKRERRIARADGAVSSCRPNGCASRTCSNFSGGMQQKIIIARWLLLEPKVLILDEPTKGVDIGTRASIYAILRDIAAKGAAILIVSSEFEELLGLADRVIVISDGASIADMPSAYLDEEKLTLMAAPRTSMERNRRLLQELADQCDGAAFWAILDEERVFCLNAATANASADPALRAGAAPRFEETPIADRAESARRRISWSIRQAA